MLIFVDVGVHSLFASYVLKSLEFRRFRMKKGFEIIPEALLVEMRGIEPRSDDRTLSLLRA